jgi:fatty acid synthase, animal type
MVVRKNLCQWIWFDWVSSHKNYIIFQWLHLFSSLCYRCSRAMLANRISYTLGLIGPSFLLDTACSSSMYALDMAFNSIRNGECDAALVGGSNLLLHPYVTLQFARLGVLAMDGYCRPFSNDATGYTRSEAVCVVYLQKIKNAKRNYGSLVYSKTNCDGYKEEGITYPSGNMQAQLLSEFYEDIGVNPSTVDYVEAHSTGTVVGDPEECTALDKVFCTGRSTPLLVGSVKSNIGHSESTSGACSIAKAVLSFHTGLIPPNINFATIREGIKSLEEGRLKVVTEPTRLEGPLIGINSFGFGGANAHALLKANDKKKVNNGAPSDSLPRLVPWSGRTEVAVETMLNNFPNHSLDAEYVALLHNIQSEPTPGNVFRGYGIYQHVAGDNALSLGQSIQHYSGLKRPLVWVFSGMGSQWTGMGASLMQIPLFKQSIQRCHDVLATKNLDLISIITSPDETTFDNILHSFVGIAAIQVALVDILRELHIVPDFIIGHSVGELGCAYADGCFTAEEMVLAAYSRGMASIETKVVKGSMAAIGMGFRKIKSMLPPEIEVACHNSADSCTISGPAEIVATFVKKLQDDGIFAKEVPCSNIAYHSRYIAEMGPKLLTSLNEIIKTPKIRSAKWLCSSVPKIQWDLPESQYSSAHYHTNNLLSPVLFEETSALLPVNALTIEIAPHGLLQAIIRKSMPKAVHIGLTQRGNKDNSQFLLAALGK